MVGMKKLLPLLGLLSLLAGCSKISTETTFKPDGSFTRAITFTTSKENEDSTLDKVFELPKGSEWKVVKKDDAENLVAIYTRSGKLGETPSTDIKVLSPTGVILTNRLAVTEATPGVYEYKETFTWQGKGGSFKKESANDFVDGLKNVLPSGTEDALIKKVASDLQKDILRIMFGPGDPLISELMTNPDHFARKLKMQLGKSLENNFVRNLDDWQNESERANAIRSILTNLDSDKFMSKPKTTEPPSDEDSGGMVPLALSVKVPGKIIETNGLYNPYTNEVYWGMFPEAASLGPVSLFIRFANK